jgi:hypothetical protein
LRHRLTSVVCPGSRWLGKYWPPPEPPALHCGSFKRDSLPHNGAVVTLLAVCGMTHRDSYFDIVMVGIVGAILALVAVIVLGTMFGSF